MPVCPTQNSAATATAAACAPCKRFLVQARRHEHTPVPTPVPRPRRAVPERGGFRPPGPITSRIMRPDDKVTDEDRLVGSLSPLSSGADRTR